MEPGFYRCKKCNSSWSRIERKWGSNGPRVCPGCGAGDDDQCVDERRERAYVSETYAPVVEAVFGTTKEG